MENETRNYEDLINHYKNDPFYGKCYEGVIKGLTALCIRNTNYLDIQYFVNIFKVAEENVERVLHSNLKEIEIMRAHSEIINRGRNIENRQGQVYISVVTPERIIGFLTDQVFLIVLWDKMEERSSYTKQFEDCRSYINNLNDETTYKGNPLWTLLAERLPEIKDRPRIEDLEVKIANLQEQLKQGGRATLNSVTYLMNMFISKLSSAPNELKDIDKARLIVKISGYKENSIITCLSRQKKNEDMPSEENLKMLNEMLSKVSISTK